MFWSFQSISLLKVGKLKEESAHFGGKKQNSAEEKQEDRNALYIVNRVIRVKADAIKRNTVRVFLFLNFYAIRVVRAHFVQRENVQYHQRKQHYGQRYHVQRKETIERNAR